MIQDLIEQGLQQHNAGRLLEAKSLYEQALAINPRQPDALHLLGLAALQSGAPEQAVTLIRQAVDLQPRNWAFRGNLAMAFFELRRFEEAQATFKQASKLRPDEPQLEMGIANCMAMRGELAAAEAQLRKLIRRRPGFALAWLNLGNSVRDQGRMEEAAPLFRRAIQLDANLAEAYNNLAAVLLKLGRLDEAEREIRRGIETRPDDVLLHCNFASVLIDCGKFAEAEAECRTALALQPHFPMALSTMGAALGHQGRLHDALAYHQEAVAMAPEDMRSLVALGIAYTEIGLAARGLPVLERALLLEPDNWQAHLCLATAKRGLGEFDDGWREYVYRPGRERFIKLYPDVKLSTTLPDELAGKHVCVQREQGLGDQLFFLRYADALKRRGARLTYRSTPKIASLLERVAALDHVIPDTEAMPQADHTVLAGDLPWAVLAANVSPFKVRTYSRRRNAGATRTYATRFPRAHTQIVPVLPPALPLAPLPERIAAMKDRLAQLGPPPYLGLTWRAGTAPEDQPAISWVLFKQIPLQGLAHAAAAVDATFLALQRNPEPGEMEQVAASLGKPLHDLTALNEDLEAMLALLALIDDYVGVSNTNMHLRAGVGRTARVLVPCPAEWRWMAKGEESPWFPGFRVYRQNLNGDWSAALQRLASDLRAAQYVAKP
ncbi:MAG TPA: tetratricopeptide repeat protein [Burkholderiales bacterium]|nr:tetratricopeptide repeat protein [Burkholderiales bacterium]